MLFREQVGCGVQSPNFDHPGNRFFASNHHEKQGWKNVQIWAKSSKRRLPKSFRDQVNNLKLFQRYKCTAWYQFESILLLNLTASEQKLALFYWSVSTIILCLLFYARHWLFSIFFFKFLTLNKCSPGWWSLAFFNVFFFQFLTLNKCSPGWWKSYASLRNHARDKINRKE